MRSLSALLRSKIGIALVGAVVLGGMGAVMGATSAWQLAAGLTGGGYFANNDPSVTATSAAGSAISSPGATNGAGTPSGSGNPTPSATSSAASAPTSAPTTPPGGTGQTVDLHGSIGKIDTSANKFILNVSGSSRTIVVNGQTSFQGSASSLQGLRTGWQAEVKGQAQSDSTFLAFLVNSDSGA